ncbi:MAG: sulfatase [Phycisphaerae bacterium]
MNRRRFLRLMGAAGTGAAVAVASCTGARPSRASAPSSDRPPNILFLFIDDLGWRDVGFMGSTFYETPHIDRLARAGMVFTDAYANAPNCAPTRACLMSGQYGPRHGVYTVGSSTRGKAKGRKLIPIENNTTLPAEVVTLAESLKAAGYATCHLGKWHLGGKPETKPGGQGFDVNVGGNHAGHPRTYFSPYRNPDIEDGPEGEYLTDRLTDEALRFIDAHRHEPFFVYLAHYAVHTPVQAKKELIEKYEKKEPSGGHDHPVYAAMIESVDQGVGRILRRLDDLGLADDTLVVFFSDNGGCGGYEELGVKGLEITSQAPLKGGKGTLYEGGIRVPMAVRWPGRVPPGTRCAAPVIGLDFYPTLLEAAGGKPPDGQVLDGESLVALMTQKGDLDRDAIYWHFPAYLQGGGGTWRTTPGGIIRSGDWKLIEYFEDGHLELYNLRDDIGETTNLADRQPEKAKALHGRLVAWRKETGAPVPTEKNPKFVPSTRRG